MKLGYRKPLSCPKCGESDPEKFGKNRSNNNGLDTYCKTCSRNLQAEYKKKNPEKYVAANRRWNLKLAGWTPEEFEACRKEQRNRCAICKQPPTKKNPLVPDHDHVTGLKRGLIHQSCNLMLGHAKDDPSRLLAGAQYLQQYREN